MSIIKMMTGPIRKLPTFLTTCVLIGTLISVPGVMDDVSLFPAGGACPICGCEANHCDAGIPGHLDCRAATIQEKLLINARKETFNNANRLALGPLTSLCNEVVGGMAELLGFKGFHVRKGTYPYMPANEIADYLASGGGDNAGWKKVSGVAITQHADVGQLVVGVIHGNEMGREHGHTFVVLPDSKYTAAGGEMRILHASYDAKIPTEEPLSKAIRSNFLSKVQYYVFTRR